MVNEYHDGHDGSIRGKGNSTPPKMRSNGILTLPDELVQQIAIIAGLPSVLSLSATSRRLRASLKHPSFGSLFLRHDAQHVSGKLHIGTTIEHTDSFDFGLGGGTGRGVANGSNPGFVFIVHSRGISEDWALPTHLQLFEQQSQQHSRCDVYLIEFRPSGRMRCRLLRFKQPVKCSWLLQARQRFLRENPQSTSTPHFNQLPDAAEGSGSLSDSEVSCNALRPASITELYPGTNGHDSDGGESGSEARKGAGRVRGLQLYPHRTDRCVFCSLVRPYRIVNHVSKNYRYFFRTWGDSISLVLPEGQGLRIEISHTGAGGPLTQEQAIWSQRETDYETQGRGKWLIKWKADNRADNMLRRKKPGNAVGDPGTANQVLREKILRWEEVDKASDAAGDDEKELNIWGHPQRFSFDDMDARVDVNILEVDRRGIRLMPCGDHDWNPRAEVERYGLLQSQEAAERIEQWFGLKSRNMRSGSGNGVGNGEYVRKKPRQPAAPKAVSTVYNPWM
ncbi:hypothetical protein HK102_002251 [Quaeritorhiza haematococci]|nr:hypothetical protein HK102_002251 [Quaeritorhiza haematococci]